MRFLRGFAVAILGMYITSSLAVTSVYAVQTTYTVSGIAGTQVLNIAGPGSGIPTGTAAGKLEKPLKASTLSIFDLQESHVEAVGLGEIKNPKQWAIWGEARAKLGRYGETAWGRGSGKATIRTTWVPDVPGKNIGDEFVYTFGLNVEGNASTQLQSPLFFPGNNSVAYVEQRFAVALDGIVVADFEGESKVSTVEAIDLSLDADEYLVSMKLKVGHLHTVNLVAETEAYAASVLYADTTAIAKSDYSSTFTWLGLLECRDLNGNIIPTAGITIRNDEGVDFALPHVVPEPATVLLVVPVLLVLISGRYRHEATM